MIMSIIYFLLRKMVRRHRDDLEKVAGTVMGQTYLFLS